jgi:hypothetical protein
MDERDLEKRIRERAHRIWEEEGRPEGKEAQHWDLAKLAVAQEDAQKDMLLPIKASESEPLIAVENQAEFPTLTDQGEQHNPAPLTERAQKPQPRSAHKPKKKR